MFLGVYLAEAVVKIAVWQKFYFLDMWGRERERERKREAAINANSHAQTRTRTRTHTHTHTHTHLAQDISTICQVELVGLHGDSSRLCSPHRGKGGGGQGDGRSRICICPCFQVQKDECLINVPDTVQSSFRNAQSHLKSHYTSKSQSDSAAYLFLHHLLILHNLSICSRNQ